MNIKVLDTPNFYFSDKPDISRCHKSSFEEAKEKQHFGKANWAMTKVEKQYIKNAIHKDKYFEMTPWPFHCILFLFL